MENMKVEILSIDEAESRGWNNMVAEHPLGSVFHHTAYGKVIQATFHHMTPYYVSLIGLEGACFGGLVLFLVKSWLTGNRLVSIPWASYCDPLVRTPEEFELIFSKVIDLSKEVKASYIEINSRDISELLKEPNLMIPLYHYNAHFLDITEGLDAVWHRFHRSLRNKIRKAERQGIEVRLAQSETDVISFYHLWCRHRKTQGLPAHRIEYFQNMWRYLANPGLAQFWIAEKEGEMLGGLCNFSLKQTVFQAYIAAEGAFRQAGGGPYMTWIAIQGASRDGMNIVDFGKTPVGFNNLRVYKDQWGVQEIETPVFYYPRVMGLSSFQDEKKLSYRAMRYFWKVAPPRLSKVASSFFWRHTG